MLLFVLFVLLCGTVKVFCSQALGKEMPEILSVHHFLVPLTWPFPPPSCVHVFLQATLLETCSEDMLHLDGDDK